MNDALIIDAVRTPIGRYAGVLSSVRADDLGAVPLRELLRRHPLPSPVPYSPRFRSHSIESLIFLSWRGTQRKAGLQHSRYRRSLLLPRALRSLTWGCHWRLRWMLLPRLRLITQPTCAKSVPPE